MEMDFERRFGGVRRLYGEAGLAKLTGAHVVVVGIGGVGSWAAEVLARNAVGSITLIDLDNIAESNFNRQLPAVEGNIGKPKVTAMCERILAINPSCQVRQIEDFITPENIEQLLHFSFDGLIDCVDDAKAKVALINFCKRANVPIVVSGGAGGRLDPARIQLADLAHVHGDKLIAKVRNVLRKDYAFPQGNNTPKKSPKFGISCIYSDEPVTKPVMASCDIAQGVSGLNCAGYGSAVSVTATFGMLAAQVTLNQVLQ
ncbi:MAG: tRNA threonylcarbamoyladenosine dehydratase [Betaproteobacteria bacterium HGW-Betaproteobacteria-22]|nr:MAG: tRNA threonylcarbamoyladenosine dehydratase [Betaproteobacteria bacterium HGW-Betaproteobacteria-22]